jgi:hypothetical protein
VRWRAAPRRVHAHVRVRVKMHAAVVSQPRLAVRLPVRAVQRVRPARVSALVQIRREFGRPPARAASGTSARGGGSVSSTGGGQVVTNPAATAQAKQTQAEFGFEK